MQTLSGKPISPGYAHGVAVPLGGDLPALPKAGIGPDQVEAELARLRAALEASRRDLMQVQARVRAELGSTAAEIFSAHLMFLEDRQFIDSVERGVREQRLNVETAIQRTIDELARVLDAADNAYLRERAADMRDLERRLLRQIARLASARPTLASHSVIVARELLPSDLLEFDRSCLAGIVTEQGGETSHAAILARALGVPAVTGVCDATKRIRPAMPILIDGQRGEVILEPLPGRLRATIADKARYDRTTQDAVASAGQRCTTRDGVAIEVLANIGRPFETEQVIARHMAGVGLFRTEYLFLEQPAEPSFDAQRDLYRQVAAALAGRELVIRTMDLGGDKWPAFLQPRLEANPNLGVRGLRFSLLAAQDLFRTQIRAVLHAAQDHAVQIMLPMVLGRGDLVEALAVMREVAEAEGIAELPPVGALIETPSAVFTIEDILGVVDFVSIGTNDLTQFMLAADRNALAVIDDYTVLHPSVLRAVHRVITAAQGAGKPVAVCGEAAGDARVACLLVGLGVRRLSMSPMSAARVTYALRACDSASLERLAVAALGSDAPQAVSDMIDEALRETVPELGSGPISV